jgi:hypothetical protein
MYCSSALLAIHKGNNNCIKTLLGIKFIIRVSFRFNMAIPTRDVISQYVRVDVPSGELLRAEAERAFPDHVELFLSAFADIRHGMEMGDAGYRRALHPTSWRVESTLRELQGMEFSAFDNYLEAMRLSGSGYDAFTEQKIAPDFTRQELALAFAHLPPQFDQITLDELTDTLFNRRKDPKLPLERGFWPREVRRSHSPKRGVLKILLDHPGASSPWTAVEIGPRGGIRTTRFTQLLGEELYGMHEAMMSAANKLGRITEETGSEPLRLYLDFMTKESNANISLSGKHPYTPSDIAMIRAFAVKNPVPFMVEAEFGSGYDDGLGIKRALSGGISLETEECRDLRRQISGIDDTQALENTIPFKPAIRKNVRPVPVLVMDAIYRMGSAGTGAQGIAVTYRSEDKRVVDEEGAVIVGWNNIIKAKAHHILAPMAREILPKGFVAQYGDSFEQLIERGFAVGILLHELSHFIGDQKDYNTTQKILGKDFTTFNEDKGETGRINLYDHAITEGFMGLSRDEFIEFCEATFVADMFRQIRFGGPVPFATKHPYYRFGLMRFDFLEKAGAYVVQRDGRIGFDRSAFRDAKAEIYSNRLEMMQEPTIEAAQRWSRDHTIAPESSNGQTVTRTLQRIQALGIPRDIATVYKF